MAAYISPQQYAEVAREVFGRPNRNLQTTKELDREIHESLIGCSYIVCAELWNMIQPHTHNKLHDSHPMHLLWALLFLKFYCTLPILSRIVGTSDREFSNRSWPFVEAIHDLVHRVINFSNRWKNWNQRSQALASLDDVDCPCMEFYPFNKGMYSHKFNGPAWRYEIGYSIFGKDFVWVDGPFKAGESEITLFREAGLRNSLEPLECVECDSGYKGDFKLKNPSTGANRSE